MADFSPQPIFVVCTQVRSQFSWFAESLSTIRSIFCRGDADSTEGDRATITAASLVFRIASSCHCVLFSLSHILLKENVTITYELNYDDIFVTETLAVAKIPLKTNFAFKIKNFQPERTRIV